MVPPFLRFQAEELSIWTIRMSAKGRPERGFNSEMENRFGSVGLGSSEITNMNLYQNRCTFSTIISDSGDW
jgi:hypothetical protein